MQYYGTNGYEDCVSFKEAVLKGVAQKGGLYMPATLPVIPKAVINNLTDMSIVELGYVVVGSLLSTDLSLFTINSAVKDTFSFPIPLVKVAEDLYVLELFHGPTNSFRDIGLRFMVKVLEQVRDDSNRPFGVIMVGMPEDVNSIKVAFEDVKGINLYFLYPVKEMVNHSMRIGRKIPANIKLIGVRGTFDDCRELASAAISDDSIQKVMQLTTTNSQNIARLLPQVVPYFYAYTELLKMKEQRQVVFGVPTGNLGNLTAGAIAKRLGLTDVKFVSAVNFVNAFTGESNIGRANSLTPDMNVAEAPNLSRLKYLYKGDDRAILNDITLSQSSDEEIIECIKSAYEKAGYLMDPHTAAAYLGLKKHLKPGQVGVVCATHSPTHSAKIVGIDDSTNGREIAFYNEMVIQPKIDQLKNILTSKHNNYGK